MDTKILSQWEIDSLLSTVSGTTVARPLVERGEGAKIYDFRHPDKFSKDHIRSLQVLFETFARLMGSALSSYVRSGVQVHLSSVEQIAFDEYITQLPEPAIIVLVAMNPLPDRLILELSPTVVFPALDRLLGGTGKGGGSPIEFGEIEIEVLRGVARRILPCFKESWSSLVPVEPQLEDIVFTSQFIQSALPGGSAVLVVLEIALLGISGTASVCIPYTVLEPVMGDLNFHIWLGGSSGAGRSTVSDHVRHQLERATIPVAVKLGEADISVRDLASLRVSDVIVLDTSPGRDLEVTIGNSAKFLAQPGLAGDRVAVQITKLVTEG